jgi:hypothetical protein
MYCKYGAFNFEPWEASLSVNARLGRTKRGFKDFQYLSFSFEGDVVGADQNAINTRLQQIFLAFSTDGQSCGLMKDDNTPSVHWMPNTATEPLNLSDVQVVDMVLPRSTNGEFASGRHFKLDVTSIYDTHTSEIIEWEDSLRRSSNAGPEWEWRRNKTWGFHPVKVSPSTMQTIVHEGHSIGATGWVLPPAPFYAPPFEANHLRVVSHQSPVRYPGGYFGFRTNWRYTYTLPTFDDTTAPTSA